METVPGVITKEELQKKLRSMTTDINSLPKEERVKYPPGNKLEEDLRQADVDAATEAAAETERKKTTEAKPASTSGTGGGSSRSSVPSSMDRPDSEIDVYAEMQNNLIFRPLEELGEFPEGSLVYTPEEQWLLNKLKPEGEQEMKPSWTNYWSINLLMAAGKGIKALIMVKRRKKLQKP